ncbi:MAG: DUF1571 domain-containing protein [Myxococcaceae bacterium]|nr:DUF1571 domain-containing protein [Myxococcaceae bacterium]
MIQRVRAPHLVVGLLLSIPHASAEEAAPAPKDVSAAALVAKHELPDVEAFAKLSLADRRAVVKGARKAEIEALFKATPIETLLAVARQNVRALGTYSATVVKTERVDGELIDTQTIDTWVQEKPHAVRMTYVDGPGKGRRVVFNSASAEHGHEIRVKEAGLAGLAGPLWIDIDSGLTRKESNYSVTAMSLGAMLQIVTDQMHDCDPRNYIRHDEGMGPNDRYYLRFEPRQPGRIDLRLGFDVETGVLSFVEVRDQAGLRERHDWRYVKQRKLPENYFTPEAAGL